MSVDNDGSHRLSAMEFKIARLAMHARLATPPHAEKKFDHGFYDTKNND